MPFVRFTDCGKTWGRPDVTLLCDVSNADSSMASTFRAETEVTVAWKEPLWCSSAQWIELVFKALLGAIKALCSCEVCTYFQYTMSLLCSLWALPNTSLHPTGHPVDRFHAQGHNKRDTVCRCLPFLALHQWYLAFFFRLSPDMFFLRLYTPEVAGT